LPQEIWNLAIWRTAQPPSGHLQRSCAWTPRGNEPRVATRSIRAPRVKSTRQVVIDCKCREDRCCPERGDEHNAPSRGPFAQLRNARLCNPQSLLRQCPEAKTFRRFRRRQSAIECQQQTPLPASRTHAMASTTATTIVPIAIARRLVADRPPYRAARKSPRETTTANPPPTTLTTTRMSPIARELS